MSTRRKRTHGDPRNLGGNIARPGGPRDRNAVVIDTTDAVLLDDLTVAVIEPSRDGQPQPLAYAMQMSGRINKTTDNASILFLFDEDGLAGIVTELLAVASRNGTPDMLAEVLKRLEARWVTLGEDDAR